MPDAIPSESKSPIRNGATAPPMDDPLSKNAVARARSRLGNHSETALVSGGPVSRFAGSQQKAERSRSYTGPPASDVSIEIVEYQTTVRVRPRRVPTRSINLPKTVCPIE